MKRFGVFIATFLLSVGVMAADIFNFQDTWNNGATTWDSIKVTITDTGSAADSKMINLIRGTDIFYVDRNANISTTGTVNGRDLAADGTKLDGIAPGAQTGDLLAAGTIPLTANWDVGAFGITALRFISDQATGTAPFDVASTTVVTNLNADLLDGNNSLSFATAAQGTLADSATQPADNISTLTNDTGFITSVEGSAVLSTGEIGGNKFLREDGDGTSSWQAIAGGGDLLADGTVPLTANWDVGSFDITASEFVADSIQFDLAAGVSVAQGQMAWNADEETVDIGLNGAVLQAGQEVHYHARNDTGVLIPDGTAVMATGTLGASGRITIGLMDGSDITNAKFFLGITTEAIADGTDGKVTFFGKVRGIKTDYATWANGDVLWVDNATPGGLTNVEPTSNSRLPIAFIVYAHATSGVIAVRSTDGTYLAEAHDTQIASEATGEVLQYNGTAWINDKVSVSSLANGTDGELITWDATGAPATVAVGTAAQVLTSNGVGLPPTFQAAAGGASPLTTKGDLYTYDTGDARLAIGADTFVLTADSAETTGIKWAAATGGGDLINDTTPQLGGDLDVNGFDISQAAPLTDIVTTDFVVEGQSALLGATVNTSAGNLDLKMGDHATAGGSAGLVRILAPDDTVAFSIDENGDLAGKTFMADLTNGNYAYGLGAGDSIIVGGLDNITIAEGAGTAITLGDNNILIGKDSGIAISTASSNVGIGFEALNDLNAIQSAKNTAIGYRAGDKITSGDTNLVLGADSGGGLSTGTDNVVLNRGAGLTTGSQNIEIFTGTGSVPDGTASSQIGIGFAGGGVYTGWKPIITGHMGAMSTEDVSGESLEITGPSARLNVATNPHGGDLIVQGGFATTTSAGIGGDLILQAGTGGNTGSNGLTLVNDTVYGIMSIQANVTGETTVDGTPRKVTAWNTDGISNGITPDHTTGDDITCDVAGTYKVNVNLSFSGTNSSVITVELYKNGAAAGFALERTLNAAGAVGAASISGIVNCAATDTFEVYQSSTGSAITFTEGQFTAHRLSN